MSATLNERELNFLGQIWQCLKSAPEVDMDKLAGIAGYKTKASTNTAYHKLKAKILAAGNAAEDDEADVEDSAVPSPTVKKGRGKKAAPVKTEESEEEDDEADEASPTKLTASGRPSRAAAPKSASVSKPAAAARPKSVRAPRATVKTKVNVQVSEDSDEEVTKRISKGPAIKRGTTPEESWYTVSTMIMQAAGVDPTVDNEKVASPAHGTKRAATEVPSDVEDFEVKRVKGDNEVADTIETPPASDAASFGDTVPSDTEIDLTQVTDADELAPAVHEI